MEICENVHNQCIKKKIFVTITVKLTYLRIFLHWEFFPNSSVSGIYPTVASIFLKLNKIYRAILRRIFKVDQTVKSVQPRYLKKTECNFYAQDLRSSMETDSGWKPAKHEFQSALIPTFYSLPIVYPYEWVSHYTK